LEKGLVAVHQESYSDLDPKPNPVNEYIEKLQNVVAIRIFDEQNQFIDEAIVRIALMVEEMHGRMKPR